MIAKVGLPTIINVFKNESSISLRDGTFVVLGEYKF